MKNKTNLDDKNITSRKNIILRFLTNKVAFTLHAFLYLAVMALLMVIWLVTISSGPLIFWPVFPMLGWGIGIGIHAVTYLMFNDKIEFLTKIRKQSSFGILFIYHALIYTLVNLIIITANLMSDPTTLVFGWTLGMWGIIFGIHALGFFTFEIMLKREMNFFDKKYPQFEEKKHKMMARTKILNFWLLITNIAYFIVGNVLIYTLVTGDIMMEGTLAWATFVGVHAFAYIFYYYVISIKAVFRGLIIHLVFFGATMGWVLYQLSSELPRINALTISEPFILWGILLGVHTFVAYKWQPILADATVVIERQVGDSLDKYVIHSRARWLAFWKWSYMAHIAIYGTVFVLSAIQLSLESEPMILLIHVAFGEGIGLAVHGAIYYVLLKNIRAFWGWTFFIHLVVYVVTGVYLIVINIIFAPGIAWSAIALAGWGIGLGLHFLIARFTQSYQIIPKDVEIIKSN